MYFKSNTQVSYNLGDIKNLSLQKAGNFLAPLYFVNIEGGILTCNSYGGAHRLVTAIAALKFYYLQAEHQAQNSAKNTVIPTQKSPESAASAMGKKDLPKWRSAKRKQFPDKQTSGQ